MACRRGVSATFLCWHILLLPPPSLQLPQQLLGIPGIAGTGWLLQVPLSCCSRSAAALMAVSRDRVECPSGPARSHGWRARAVSHQCCPSEEQGLSSPWGRSSGHAGARRASPGPWGLQYCSSNIPSGAQPGVTLARPWAGHGDEPPLSLLVHVC